MKKKINTCWDCKSEISKKGICNCNRDIEKSQRGGKRKGAGRKSTGAEPTKVMRVPMSLVSHVQGMIKSK